MRSEIAAEDRRLRNAITVDVEDYFQVEAFAGRFPRSDWDSHPRRVEANVDRLLDIFAAARICGTFFTLGWLAERHPAMVRRIAAAGHELASHGYDHRRLDHLDPQQFRADIRRSKKILEEIVGTPVLGYRAPTFSIGRCNPWAYEILEKEGYRYSSSLYPIRHDLYGAPDASPIPFRPGPGDFWELPLATRRLFRQNLPCAGGGYFRLVPYWLSRANLARVNAGGRPCIFYLHPWEIDPEQPRVSGIGPRARFRHYTNLSRMAEKIERLLSDFKWGRVVDIFADQILGNQPTRFMAIAG